MSQSTDLNFIDLFAGIGGFSIGAEKAGFKFANHFFSEVEKYPIQVYQKRFPHAKALGDITKIDFGRLKESHPGNWLVAGGFP